MSNDKQQTTVENFYDEVWSHFSSKLSWSELEKLNNLKEKAKEMEKEHIMNAYMIGALLENISIEAAEHYYNKTYGGGEQ
jgi:hypothetical protein